jgi:hypothetical protein
MAGAGGFEVVDGVLESCGGMGLLWWGERAFRDFTLDVHWQVTTVDDKLSGLRAVPGPAR